MSHPKIYIVDDDTEVTRALEWLFKSVQISTQIFLSPNEFLSAYPALEQGCILLDVRMPQISGMELLRILPKNPATLPIIIITGHGDIPMAVQAIKLGAVDFITKPFNEQSLLEKIQKALLQTSERIDSYIALEKVDKAYKSLSQREMQILNYIVDGTLNKQIAFELNIAISTVEMHRSKVMQKMNANNLAQLIKKVLLLRNTEL